MFTRILLVVLLLIAPVIGLASRPNSFKYTAITGATTQLGLSGFNWWSITNTGAGSIEVRIAYGSSVAAIDSNNTIFVDAGESWTTPNKLKTSGNGFELQVTGTTDCKFSYTKAD